MYEYVKQEKAPIQRKVGFEFQGLGKGAKQVYKVKEGQEARTTGRIDVEKPGNDDILGKIGNIKVTADGYNLEYVTPAYDEHDDSQIISARNDCINAAIWHYHNHGRPLTSLSLIHGGKQVSSSSNTWIRINTTKDTYYIRKTSQSKVHPQASLGVSFQAIPELFRSLSAARQIRPVSSNPLAAGPLAFGGSSLIKSFRNRRTGEKRTKQEIVREQFIRFQKISQDFPRVLTGFSAEGQALAHVLAQMAYMTNINPEYSRTSKTVYAVMPRTSPGEVYHRLPENEKHIFQKALNPASNVPISPSDISLAQELQTYLTKFGNVMVPGPLGIPKTHIDGTRLTFSDWLTNVTNNSEEFHGDVHTLGEINTVNLPYLSGTYGNMASPFDIGNGKEGMILELRALPRSLSSPEQWVQVVTAVLRLAKQLNAPETSGSHLPHLPVSNHQQPRRQAAPPQQPHRSGTRRQAANPQRPQPVVRPRPNRGRR